jgi:hypothetical protein
MLDVTPPRFTDISLERYPQHHDAELLNGRPDRTQILPIPLEIRYRQCCEVTVVVTTLDVVPYGSQEAFGSQIKHLRLRVSLAKAAASFSRTRATLGFDEETTTGRNVTSNHVDAFLCRFQSLLETVTVLFKVAADSIYHVVLIQHGLLRDV